jgi:Glycosyl hydrolase family 26
MTKVAWRRPISGRCLMGPSIEPRAVPFPSNGFADPPSAQRRTGNFRPAVMLAALPSNRLLAMPSSPGIATVRLRLLALIAVIIAAAVIIFMAARLVWFSSRCGAAASCLPASTSSYLGVYEKGAPDTYQPVADFTRSVGRQPNLAGYYSGWGEPFKTAFAETAHRHGAATIVQINPTWASVSAIAAGTYDSYLRLFADRVRDFGHPVVIGFGHEMNAYWYSWGYGHASPAQFIAAWRHIVMLFRSRQASNVTWLWTLQADEPGTGPIASWWPGDQYVTWVGIDGYYYRPSESFFSIFGQTIAQVRMFTGKPVLVSEAAAGPDAGQADKIRDLFAGMRQYGTLGLVWFDIAQHDGLYHQDWHIEDSPAATRAFQRGVAALALIHP